MTRFCRFLFVSLQVKYLLNLRGYKFTSAQNITEFPTVACIRDRKINMNASSSNCKCTICRLRYMFLGIPVNERILFKDPCYCQSFEVSVNVAIS